MKGTLLIPALLALALLHLALDEKAGIRPWLAMREELRDARSRNEELRREVAALEAEAVALQRPGFAQERAIREDLERVRPGELLVRMRPPTAAVPIGEPVREPAGQGAPR